MIFLDLISIWNGHLPVMNSTKKWNPHGFRCHLTHQMIRRSSWLGVIARCLREHLQETLLISMRFPSKITLSLLVFPKELKFWEVAGVNQKRGYAPQYLQSSVSYAPQLTKNDTTFLAPQEQWWLLGLPRYSPNLPAEMGTVPCRPCREREPFRHRSPCSNKPCWTWLVVFVRRNGLE